MGQITDFRKDYFYLSNFYPYRPFIFDGILYKTSEHAYQAQKTLVVKEKEKIINAETPGDAKKFGQLVPLKPKWEEIKDMTMEEVLIAKFKNDELRERLLKTWPDDLIEGNVWHDNYWGDCSCKKCKNIKGINMLGKILMKIRNQLRGK